MRLLPVLAALIAAALYADQKYDLIKLPLPEPAGNVELISPNSLPKYASREGLLSSNTLLQKHAKRLFEGKIKGSETVAVNPHGEIYVVGEHNYLWHAHHRGGVADLDDKPIAHLGPGKALGIEFDKSSNLIICNAGVGLMMLENSTGNVVLLTARVSADSPLQPDTPIHYAEDLSIAADGSIYFTDGLGIPPVLTSSGELDFMRPVDLSVFQGAMAGRLLVYKPKTRKTTVLATGLWFANGCALSLDESYILLADTIAAKIIKFHLKGPKAGEEEVILDGLPGHPDNIRTAKDGTYWVGLSAQLREPFIPILPYKVIRALIAWLPPAILPKDQPFGALVQVSGEGEVLRYLEDPNGKVIAMSTAVTEGNDGLYVGTFVGDYVGYIPNSELL